MAKKVRFLLEMEQGIEVRSVEELRKNFSLPRVLAYVSNGKLITWLRDRYANDIADAIEQLNPEDKELPKKMCELLGVPYDEQLEIDMEKLEERNRKINHLKKYTSEKEYLDVIDYIAFNQEDVYDLLDEGVDTIYLCGEKFSIPLSAKNKTYHGINNPIVSVDSKKNVDWDEIGIKLIDIRYDEKTIGDYFPNTYLNFILSSTDKVESKKLFDELKGEIEKIHYDIDDDVKDTKKMLLNSGIVGLAESYLKDL